MVGPCSCGGLFHSQSNSISMLFSMPNHKSFDATDMYPFTTSSSSSPSVDCTLSLGTPSTRLCEDDDDKRIRLDRRSAPCMSAKFRWDLLNNKSAPYSQQMAPKASRGSNGDSRNCSGNDPLLGRRCANCDTTSTPLWRKGPRGPKSLCNACGIRFKKEERRATAANANNSDIATAPMAVDQKMPCFAPFIKEFMFNEDGDRDSDNGIPFLS